MEFFDWGMLATYAGALAATGIVTQFIKGWFPNVATQVVSYVVALVVLLAASFFTGTFTAESAALSVINAIVVSLASNGTYEFIQRIKKKE